MSTGGVQYSVQAVEAALRARVVGYELFALATTVPFVGATAEPFLGRSALDSCLIHARCCIEFFVGRVNKNGQRGWNNPNDIRPSDFLIAWAPSPAADVAYLDAQLPLIDKHLSHVTITRADLFGHRWDISALSSAIEAVANTFLTELKTKAPSRHAELNPWLQLASQFKADLLAKDEYKSADRTKVRSGTELIQLPPVGVPAGAWAAWVQRYIAEKGITWPQ